MFNNEKEISVISAITEMLVFFRNCSFGIIKQLWEQLWNYYEPEEFYCGSRRLQPSKGARKIPIMGAVLLN